MIIDFAKSQFGQEEIDAVNLVLKTNWLASGEENTKFEEEFAAYVGAKEAICVNSGSSANLIALASLNLIEGSKVLTAAAGFPATLSPILHLGFTPVLVDYDLETMNADTEAVLRRIPDVQAVILAHTFGNPFNIQRIMEFASVYGVPVIEDCCEALGTRINGQHVGTFGDMGTFSFYPSHQITAGGMGGMVVISKDSKWVKNSNKLKSLRDWGKCWDWDEKLGDNKTNYDMYINDLDYKYYRHYTYTDLGWNFKLAEINAAFGREQLKRLEGFVDQRIENYEYLFRKLQHLKCFKLLRSSVFGSRVGWFGFPMTIVDDKPNRNEFGDYLESKGIRHRPFFAGNITRHYPFYGLKGHKASFEVADYLMKNSLFIGCWPGMTKEMLDYIVETISQYVDNCHSKL